jgi:hypothetical protein
MSSATYLTRRREVYDKIFIHYSPYNWLTAHTLLGKHGGREDTQLDKEHKDEVARLTSENTKLKEWVTKLDKDFASKLSTTQSSIPFTIIHHAQHGLMLECSRAPKCQDTPGGTDEGK